MKVVVAVDSFKGSLSTFQAGEAVSVGVKRVFPEAKVEISPLADGGEGTVEAIVAATGGKMRKVTVHNPLGKLIQSEYGITDQELIQLQKNAIEVSFASETLKEELRQLFVTHP